jgi:UDP-N-acetylglucosamine acyltransferase
VTGRIHPSAVVDPGARIAAGVEIGPFSVIGPGVSIGEGCRLGPHVVLERQVTVGRNVSIGAGSVLGSAPQDVKYAEESSVVEVGDGTVIREYTTINRGTAASGATIVGRNCFLMTYVHIAHDCRVGDGVTIANATQLSGHVTIEDGANLSGLIAVHQFVTIGTHAFIGGASRIPQDIPPYVKAVGNPVKLYGLNTIGLQRAGYSGQAINSLKRAYRLLFNSTMPRAEALEVLEADAAATPEVRRLVDFLSGARRGIPA